MKPNLVLVVGNKLHRYVNGKYSESCMFDKSVNIRQIKEDIEYFRQNGLGDIDSEEN